MPKDIEYIYTNVRKTHNSGVFDAYTDEMKRARKSGILTGLPDGYGGWPGISLPPLFVLCGSTVSQL
jgi:pyruvate-formate lyase